jgi:hypothetical protein
VPGEEVIRPIPPLVLPPPPPPMRRSNPGQRARVRLFCVLAAVALGAFALFFRSGGSPAEEGAALLPEHHLRRSQEQAPLPAVAPEAQLAPEDPQWEEPALLEPSPCPEPPAAEVVYVETPAAAAAPLSLREELLQKLLAVPLPVSSKSPAAIACLLRRQLFPQAWALNPTRRSWKRAKLDWCVGVGWVHVAQMSGRGCVWLFVFGKSSEVA